MQLDEKAWYGRMLVENILAVEVPVISAVNGPCSIHAEVPLLSDIVLASDTAYFQDLAHFPRGLVPGDGSHVLWPMLVGPNRARDMLLMGKKLERAGGVRVGRGRRGVATGPARRPRVGHGARARAAAAAGPAVHAPALHAELQTRIPRRVGARLGVRDLRPATVLPAGWRHAGSRPGLGSGTLVRLTRTADSRSGHRVSGRRPRAPRRCAAG